MGREHLDLQRQHLAIDVPVVEVDRFTRASTDLLSRQSWDAGLLGDAGDAGDAGARELADVGLALKDAHTAVAEFFAGDQVGR